jgi:predicted DNA-binding transcriptional regulator AlpA
MRHALAASQVTWHNAYMAQTPRYLVGAAEIGQMLSVSRQRVQQIISRRDFPRPYDELAMGKVWKRSVVEAWMREHGRLDEPERSPVEQHPQP